MENTSPNDIESNNDDINDDNMDDIQELLNSIEKDEQDVNKKINHEIKQQTNEKLNKQKNMEILSKKQLNHHLQCKLDKLSHRLKVLQIKYMGYKKWYDKLNIMIIIISSSLSIFEAFRNEINDHIQKESSMSIFMNMAPIAVSSFITCSAAVIKFKKYQDKMEHMQFTREKVILSISKIKHIQEMLWFSKSDDFDSIKKKYLDDIYGFYNESSSELERHIKFTDHKKLIKLTNP